MRWLAVILFVVVALGQAAGVLARQNDPRLDPLFDALLTTDDGPEAQTLERRIWDIWLESGDEKIDALMAIGTRAMGERKFKLALESFDAVIEADADYAEGWNKRATLYYLMGDYEASIADVQRTLALEPRHFGALSGMGLISAALEDEKAALDWYDQALAVNPHMPFIKLRAEILRAKLRGEAI